MEKTTYIRFLVSNAAADSVVGNGGATITDLQSQSEARIQLSHKYKFFPGTSDRIVMISGNIDAVLKAVELVIAKLLSEPHSEDSGGIGPGMEVRLIVPNGSCECIIGEGGAIIKSFIEESEAGIKIPEVDHDFYGLTVRLVILTGTLNEQMRAIGLILSKLVEDPHYSHNNSTPFSDLDEVPYVASAVYNVRNYEGQNLGVGKFQNNKDESNTMWKYNPDATLFASLVARETEDKNLVHDVTIEIRNKVANVRFCKTEAARALAIGDIKGLISLYDTRWNRTGKKLTEWNATSDTYRALLEWANEDTYIIQSSADCLINYWDVEEESLAQTLSGHSAMISDLSPDPTCSYLLASADCDGIAKLWDTRVPSKLLRNLPSGSKYEHQLILHLKRHHELMTASKKHEFLKVWDARKFDVEIMKVALDIRRPPGDLYGVVTLHQDSSGEYIIAARGDCRVDLIDAYTLRSVKTFGTLNDQFDMLLSKKAAISADASCIVRAYNDGSCNLWKVGSKNYDLPVKLVPSNENYFIGLVDACCERSKFVTSCVGGTVVQIWDEGTLNKD